jgi:AhpD family alkylhydroperoxidase
LHKDWKTSNQTLSQAITDYRKASPELARAFSGLAAAATTVGELSPKTKELIAMAIGIAGRCDGCIGFHTAAAIRHGATRAEVLETIDVAIYMGGGPSYVYGAQALEAFDQLSEG